MSLLVTVSNTYQDNGYKSLFHNNLIITISFLIYIGLDCPANSHYELCGIDCGHTCASSVDAICEPVCSEGCFCDEGFLRSGTKCVPVESCGCLYDGFYYNVSHKALHG